jgi:hypothetical protein
MLKGLMNFLIPHYFFRSMSVNRDSSFGTATSYGLVRWGSISGMGKISLFATASRLALGPTQQPIQWVPGALSLGVKRPGHEADNSPSTAEFENSGSISPLPRGKIPLFATASRLALGPTQQPIQWVPGALFLGVKWPVHEADHSPSSTAEFENSSYTSTPSIYIHGILLN